MSDNKTNYANRRVFRDDNRPYQESKRYHKDRQWERRDDPQKYKRGPMREVYYQRPNYRRYSTRQDDYQDSYQDRAYNDKRYFYYKEFSTLQESRD